VGVLWDVAVGSSCGRKRVAMRCYQRNVSGHCKIREMERRSKDRAPSWVIIYLPLLYPLVCSGESQAMPLTLYRFYTTQQFNLIHRSIRPRPNVKPLRPFCASSPVPLRLSPALPPPLPSSSSPTHTSTGTGSSSSPPPSLLRTTTPPALRTLPPPPHKSELRLRIFRMTLFRRRRRPRWWY